MKEFNNLEVLLGIVADLLKTIPMHQGPIEQNLTPETILELERLEAVVAKFDELNKETFKSYDIDIDQLRRETIDSDKITPKQKQLLRKSLEIERQARILQAQYAQILARSRIKSPQDKQKDSLKKDRKDRRNRYKPVGGDKKWIPI